MIGTLVHYYKKTPGQPLDGPHAAIITSQIDEKYGLAVFLTKSMIYIENATYWNESDSTNAPFASWRHIPKNFVHVDTDLPDRFELLGWRIPSDNPPKLDVEEKPAGLWTHATCDAHLDMIVSDLRADRDTEVFATDGTKVIIPQGWHMAFVPPSWRRKE